MFDAIIVGSGAAAMAAALALRGRTIAVIDAGHRPPPLPDIDGSIRDDGRAGADRFSLLIGESFESLRHLWEPSLSLKLKAPLMDYITRDAGALSPVRTTGHAPVMSFAAGGLANAWGAGVFRFTDRDLDGFPVSRGELDPWYDALTEHIGVSGANDDLAPWFGEDPHLQPPIELSRFGARLLDAYQRKRAWCAERGIAIGRPRLAVLTRPHRNRPAYRSGNFEFFRPYDPAIYNPVYTLDELIATGEVTWMPGHLAVRYAEQADGVEVRTRVLATGETTRVRGRALILAAGAINSAKLVLQSLDDYETRLPLLDNPLACLPLVRLGLLGQPIDARDTSLAQLTLIREHEGRVLQGSIYGVSGPLRSDILFQLPLCISANLSFLRRLTAGGGMLMLFHPCDPHPSNGLRLNRDGALDVRWGAPPPRTGHATLVKALRALGLFASDSTWQFPPIGAGIHYAGCLPMREQPRPYELDRHGQLHGTTRVWVVDGAAFPRLPSKNLTFTIMANAMRIASGVRSALP